MPLIEELPNSSGSRTTHGWAYVPDTGRDPAKINIPTGSRKRGVAKHAARIDNISAKQQKALQARLAELEKENFKDTSIPIPPKQKDARGARPKQTPNVKRILGYQRTFAHYLADDEAQIAQSGGTSAVQPSPSQQRSSSLRTPTQKSTNTPSKMGPPPLPRPGSSSAPSPAIKHEGTLDEADRTASHPHGAASSPGGAVDQLPKTPFDDNPLLKSHVPYPPSNKVMAALLAEPPLSYNAARAKPSTLGHPPVSFCTICGYWGKIKCKKCGERTCGLMECYVAHDGTCPGW